MPILKFKKIGVNSLLVIFSFLLALFIAEIFVRLTWNEKEGVPGLVLPHYTRIEVLAPNYEGWFSQQPLRINNLGFRDDKNYHLKKSEKTFRIIILGDSVTFGDTIKFKETWPYLFEKRLKEWNDKIDWQVWNLGIPGYDTVQELRTLEELGPTYKPDLVVIAFYENDLLAADYHMKREQPEWVFQIKAFLKSHFYLYTKIKYMWNVLKYRESDVTLKNAYIRESNLTKKPNDMTKCVDFDLSTFMLEHNRSDAQIPPRTNRIYEYHDKKNLASVKSAIADFARYHAQGLYNTVVFINIAPNIDIKNDKFIDGISNEKNNYFIQLFNASLPVVSSYEAFWSYKPSEVPSADGHSKATANLVKADVLFNFLIENNIVVKEKE